MSDKKQQRPVFDRQPQPRRRTPSRPVYDYDQQTQRSSSHSSPQRPVYDYDRQTANSGLHKAPSRPVYDYRSPASERPRTREPAPFVNEIDDAARRAKVVPRVEKSIPRRDQSYVTNSTRKSGSFPVQPPRHEMRQREWHATAQQEVPLKPRAPLYDQQAEKNQLHPTKKSSAKAKRKAVRRTDKKKKKELTPGQARRKRRIRYALAGVFVTAALAVGVVVSAATLFKIKTIEIQQPEGGTLYSDDQILAAFGHPLGENLFGFSPEESEKNLLEVLPYLETVTIQRRLPDEVVIQVTAATEYCAVTSDSGWVVCSTSLKVLRIDSQVPAGIVQVDGAIAQSPSPGQPLNLTEPDKLDAVQKVLTKAQEQGLAPINQIDVSDLYEISFLYDGRIRIVLGTVNDLDYKIDWAWRLVTPGETEEGLTESDRGTLDVSSRNEDGRGQAIWRSGSL
ncbi:cell division protein FtsQ/DivIB [uncultured Ruthenibacterium sp.]|uniref:cell division protein FtsQ/DivIB n=1 Tax=uncultured Ruthenibacterium sp. TaxID=1905347 RepID=UPI00349E7DE7